jgi:sugar phosphate isomerase/epimerase
MLIGAMNDPARNLIDQIQWFGESGFQFLDLTLEPPGAPSWNVDTQSVGDALERHHLQVVGHTAPYLPLASPIEEIRKASILELRRCVAVFEAVGVQWMNVHPNLIPIVDREYAVGKMIESLTEIMEFARTAGVGIMVENAPGQFNTAAQISELLDPIPELGLHLDLGHTNLMSSVDTAREILAAHARRIKHVHLHDNNGGASDLHLPLGAGSINLRETLSALKTTGYDNTITLEVFARDRNYLLYSRDVLRRLWDAPEVKEC